MRAKAVIFLSLILIVAPASRVPGVEEFWRGEFPNFSIRQTQAKEWLNDFKSIEKQIPTLSPSEKAWLHREIDQELAGGTYTRRALRAMDSKEYHIRYTRKHIEELINALSAISEKKFQDKKQEALFWTIAAQAMLDYQLWQSVHALINEGIVDKKTSSSENYVKDLGYLNIVLQATTIIERVVIPYLNDTLPAN